MKAAIERDEVAAAIKSAMKAIGAAQREANEDSRTASGTVCWELDQAERHIKAADNWLRELAAETRADEKREARTPNSKAPKLPECHHCEEPIAEADLALCSGCDKPTCSTCMEGEYCIECNAADD